MRLSPDYRLPPQEPPEPASVLEALRYLRTHEPELARGLEAAAQEQRHFALYIKGYEQPSTRRLVMALLRSAHAWQVVVHINPQWPPPG